MQTLNLIAGIAYRPTIAGLLVVGVGVVVLMGSVYLLLATNTGNRLGFLLAATGFFGWMAIMASIWWLYGIGMKGTAPSWEIAEYNRGDTAGAVTELVREIDLSEVPELDDTGRPDYLLLNALRTDDALKVYSLAELRNESVADLLFQFDLAVPDVARGLDVTDEAGDGVVIIDALANVPATALATLPKTLGGNWEFLESSNPKRGEAEAAVAGNLPICSSCNFEITNVSDYIILDGYRVGGKPKRPDGANLLERAGNKITNTARITHPPSYAVIQVQKVVDQAEVPGQAPPLPLADAEEPVISVVLIRNIGDLRFPAAMITIGSSMIFGLLCWLLHRRERILEANVANAEAVGV